MDQRSKVVIVLLSLCLLLYYFFLSDLGIKVILVTLKSVGILFGAVIIAIPVIIIGGIVYAILGASVISFSVFLPDKDNDNKKVIK